MDLTYTKLTSDLEVDKTKRLAHIEIEEFKEHVTAIGRKTIQAIATSGPDNQVKIFKENYLQKLNQSLLSLGQTSSSSWYKINFDYRWTQSHQSVQYSC